MPGIVTPTGLFVQTGGALVPLPVTRTPLGVALAALIAQIDAGAVQPCPHCGRYACECEDVPAVTGGDPHGDNNLDGIEIPF